MQLPGHAPGGASFANRRARRELPGGAEIQIDHGDVAAHGFCALACDLEILKVQLSAEELAGDVKHAL